MGEGEEQEEGDTASQTPGSPGFRRNWEAAETPPGNWVSKRKIRSSFGTFNLTNTFWPCQCARLCSKSFICINSLPLNNCPVR